MELSSGRTLRISTALASHSKFKPFTAVPGPELAISVCIIKRGAARKICRAAFEWARK